MTKLKKILAAAAFLALTALLPPAAEALDISEYTAFPPFLPRVVSPNILFMLDYSKSMVRPAYGTCDSTLGNCRTSFPIVDDDYDITKTYIGYFDSADNYACSSGVSGQCEKSSTVGWNGNRLNWLTTTQFDLMKKVTVGGHISPAPEKAEPGQILSLLTAGIDIKKAVDLDNCSGTPHCAKWPAITYDAGTWAGGTDITKEVNQVPASAAAMVYNKLYKTGSYDAGDEGLAKVLIPFTFKFYGNNYTDLFIHSNGIVGFDFNTLARNTFSFVGSTVIPQADVNNLNNIIAPFFRDLDVGASKIKVATSGTSPNRVFAVTYENVFLYPATNYTGGITFQILFYEGSNHIVFQYKDLTLTTPATGNSLLTGTSTVVGVENASGSDGKSYSAYAEAKLSESRAVFASDHMTYQITPDGSKATAFNVMAPVPGSADVYRVDIKLKVQTGLTKTTCPAGYWNPERGKCYDHETRGLLQDFRDGEMDGLLGFRLGIMQLNSEDGGKVIKHFNQKDTVGWPDTMNDTRRQTPLTETPLAEALYEAIGYFKEDTDFRFATTDWSPHTGNTCPATGTTYDPFCFQSAAQMVSCVKSYVLLVSSGNYSHDKTTNIWGDAANTETWSNSWSPGWRSTNDTGSESTKANGGWLDNVAYKAHTTDWRPPERLPLPGMQNLTLYAVNTSSSPSSDGALTLKKAARWGGFKDLDGDNAYDSGDCGATPKVPDEADIDCNGALDTYADAGDGSIKAKIIDAVTDILRNSASGTSVSVLSTSAGGEGALYQAYFYPAKPKEEGSYEETKWPGFLRAFFLDRYQNLRDDFGNTSTDASAAASLDAHLVLAEDRVAQMSLNPTTNEVTVSLFHDADGVLPASPSIDASVPMDEVVSIWEAGKQLATRDKGTRTLYFWLDSDSDSIVDAGESKDFTTAEASTLIPYLRASETTRTIDGVPYTTTAAQEAENIIKFIRGNQVNDAVANSYYQEFRDRCISVGASDGTTDGCSESSQKPWPLGDVVYSTPTLVASPGEKFDAIYGQPTYRAFLNLYKDRRHVVYVGANDGLLHAFNAGVYKTGDDTGNPGTDTGWFEANPSSGDNWNVALGDELWAFVPYDNLPHLAWLACNGTAKDPSVCGEAEYTHVFYVDHRPKVSDVRIFADTDTGASGIAGQANVAHPDGWGTILILPLRLGGGAIDVTADFGSGSETRQFRSAYYAFDVTDPEQPPKLLWRFTDPALGFSTSYPAIVRTGPKNDPGSWFMVVGSGPANTAGSRDYGFSTTAQTGKIFVVDLKDPNDPSKRRMFDTGVSNSIMGDPTVVDVDLNFAADVIYIGSATGTTAGRVFRIITVQSETLTDWDQTTLYDPVPAQNGTPADGKDIGPLLVAPSVSKDISGNLWVFFGTGRLRNATFDLNNSDLQRFYGIKDKCWQSTESTDVCDKVAADGTYNIDDLFDASAVAVSEPTGTNAATQVTEGVSTACDGVDSDPIAPGVQCDYQKLLTQARAEKGWFIGLDDPSSGASERVLSRSSVLGGLVLFTTYQPAADLCSILGDSKIYALYYETGTAYIKPVLPGDPDDANTTIERTFSLGKGMPTSVGVAIGETISGFVQKSTGEIIRIETQPGLGVRSGVSAWREKPGGGGTVEIETIYKHIVK